MPRGVRELLVRILRHAPLGQVEHAVANQIVGIKIVLVIHSEGHLRGVEEVLGI